jgi:uncharacterized protein YndB with AHSA1/START domain
MAAVAPTLDNMTLSIIQETHIRASLETAFAALVEQMGPANEGHAGTPMPMTLEARPGGRWFRDLGDDNGHYWGTVQAIKKPTLLEITGPLFMSAAVVSNLQYRLSPVEGGTLIVLRHTALGMIPDGVRDGVTQGWTELMARVRKQAEKTQQ